MYGVDLSLCIVNHKNRDLLRKCLESIYAEPMGVSFQVLVLDNCSEDGSLEMLSTRFPQVQVFSNSAPKGFGENQNQLLKHGLVDSRFLLMLNDDTETEPHALASAVGFMAAHPQVGVLGLRILRPNGEVQPSAWSFPTWYKEAWRFSGFSESSIRKGGLFGGLLERGSKWIPGLQRQVDTYLMNFDAIVEPRQVDWVCGAAMMFRREALQEVGLLDQSYYMYYEDVDWCKRAHDKGWQVVFYPDATVLHHGQASQSRFSVIERQRSAFRYFRLYHGRLTEMALRSVVAFLAGVRAAFLSGKWFITRNSRSDLADMVRTNLSILALALGFSLGLEK